MKQAIRNRNGETITHNISVRFAESEIEMLREMAQSEQLSMANWIRRIVVRTFCKLKGISRRKTIASPDLNAQGEASKEGDR